MAARGISSVNPQENPRDFTTALALAVLEWLLIFMLVIDAIFSYLITKFSCYCKLQTPCLLCSRLDHILGNEKVGYCWDLICGSHRLEISSLVLCRAHNKLVDVHGVCESCLFSFATINKSNAETYRLLVGKLGEDSDIGFDLNPLLEGHELGCSNTRCCSCCNEPWISRGYSQKLVVTKSIGSEGAELDLTLPGGVGHYQDELNKRRDKLLVSVRATDLRNSELDHLSHIGYSELKIASDTESEVPFSDGDDAVVLVHESDDCMEDLTDPCVKLEPHVITLAEDSASEKLIDPANAPEPLVSASQVLVDVIKPHGGTSVASTIAIGHGLEELNWQQVECKADPSAQIELNSLVDFPPSSNAMKSPVEVSKECYVTRASEVWQTPVTEFEEIHKAGIKAITTTGPSEAGQQLPNVLDLGDAYKLDVSNRGRQLSGVLAEQWTGKDSSRVSEDLKLLLSQISAARGIEQSMNETSPRVSGNIDELKTLDTSNSIGMQILQKRISLERNESGLSLDGSIVSEIEGESVVDRLKRQADHDRKVVNALYKELEEERNASTVAANQAMAMITRLQEEKATLHMEALQYLRMMEEQAEYDAEALQKSNELLAEKEKEIQYLEAELEFYRKKFPNESMAKNKVEPTSDLKARDIEVEHTDVSFIQDNASAVRNSDTEKPDICKKVEGTDMSSRDNNKGTVKNSFIEFEDERLYILRCLNKLEKKLHMLSNNGGYSHLANGEYSGSEDGISELKEFDCKGGFQENSGKKENYLSVQNDVSLSEGSPHIQGHVSSLENPQFSNKENNKLDCCGEGSPVVSRATDLVSLGNEVHDLNERLKALEAEQNFLEHTINSLRNGEEGLRFIQEIASHLLEIQRIGTSRRDQTVA